MKGGVKWVSNPHVKRMDNVCLPLWHRMLLPTKRGTHAACRGVASYPLLETMNTRNEETESTARA